MKLRRLSYVLVTLAAAMIMGCGETPPPEPPPQPAATPADTGTAQAEPPPAATQTAEPAPPPPPPVKKAVEKFSGKFVQDFSGEVADAARAEAEGKPGKKKDPKKIDSAVEAAKKKFEALGTFIEFKDNVITWTVKGKEAHKVSIEAPAGDSPDTLNLKFLKDGKRDLKAQEVVITFKGDDVLEMKDPFAKKGTEKVLVFKRQ